ncbi:MAG: hypothetical protein EXR75_03050 [Myxococcales bacterium]|nr:hypothetical protein [Myxococcales bacterium]
MPVETARLQAPTSAAPEPPHVDIEPKNRPARLVSVEDHIRESDVFLARGALDEASNELKQALGKLGTATGTVRGEIYIRRGEVLRCQGNARLAISNFEKALTMLPDDERALLPMLDIFADEGNWRAMPALEQKLLASLALGTDLRFTRLLAFGDRWLESGRDSALAIERFSAARASSPQRREPIERLRALYEQQGDIEQTIALRGELAELTEDKVLRAGLYFELGQYCLRDAASEERGLAALELAIDTDSGRLDALELLATTLAENQEWAELERVYRKMVAALAASDDAPHKKLRAVLLRRLALLYRDHLEDVTLALGAIDEELALRATDEKLARSDDVLSAYLFGAALGRELDDAGRVLGYLRGAISRAPERHDTYHDLFALAERHGEPETSFLAASVAVTLGFANEAEQALYRREKLETVPTFTRVLSAESWGWLRTPAVRGHAAGDPDVDRVMKALAPALLRVRLAQLDLAGTPSTLPGLRQDPETSTVTVVRTLAWAATQLDMVLPSVHIDDKSDALVEARVAAHQALVIGRSALSRRTVLELAFVASRHLAMRLPEHEVMAHCPSVAELSVSFLAAVKLVLGTAPGSATIVANAEALATLLATQITDAERRELEAAIMQLTSRGGALDLAAWGASVERCAARAGLLLSGSLETAIAMIRAEGDTAFSTASAKIADLCAFSVGAAFTKLRQRVGVSLVAR